VILPGGWHGQLGLVGIPQANSVTAGAISADWLPKPRQVTLPESSPAASPTCPADFRSGRWRDFLRHHRHAPRRGVGNLVV